MEDCRQKIIKLVYNPAHKFPDMPRFRDAKKVFSEYKTATKDLWGTLDLMLTYVERGHAFTNKELAAGESAATCSACLKSINSLL
ncbi:MAG: hypothetical protein RBS68_06195 [Anaerolineales bacterium]|nr:hypothetical protein [Anaerolineales bacterium]